MIYFFLILFFISILLNFFLVFYCFKFAKILLNVEDTIEECIELLDSRSESISKVLEIPLFFDSPEIRRVHDDLRASKTAILKVAEAMSIVAVEENANDDR